MQRNEFSKILKKIRKKNNENREDMAKRLNISSTHLSLLGNGKRHISKDFIDKISNEYKLSSIEKTELFLSSTLTNGYLKFETDNISKKMIVFLIKLHKVYEKITDKKIDELMKKL